MVRIQILSDLHLELLNMSQLWFRVYPIDCDILCICGDIGDPYSDAFWSFIDYARNRARYVLLVTGNHDYWGSGTEQIDFTLKQRISGMDKPFEQKLRAMNNVFHLQKDIFFYGGYAFIGCTLWSNIPAQYWDMLAGFPDFSRIQNFSPLAMNINHDDHKKWLKNSLEECKRRELKPIVLTHYSPVHNITTSPRYKNDISQHMFCTDMSELFPLVHTWLYGHTHYDVDGHLFRVKDHSTIFITNQKGYPDSVNKTFDPKLTYEPGETYNMPEFSQNWDPKPQK